MRWTPAALLPLAVLMAACGPALVAPEGGPIPDGFEGPWTEAQGPRLRVPLEGAPRRGAADPLVHLVVFSDFECHFCRQATPTIERLLARYLDTLSLTFRHLPLPMHPHAEMAANATEEARRQRGDEGFWAMHDAIMETETRLSQEHLVELGAQLGLDTEQLDEALTLSRHQDVLERDLELADRIGAGGTPTFYANGRLVAGALPLEEFALVIDREVDLAREAMAGGVPRARVYEAAMRQALAEAPRRRRVQAPADEPAEEDLELDPTVTFAVPVEGAAALGPAEAPVTIVTFSDFECPFCGRVQPTLAALRERFGDRLRIVFRHAPLPFHVNGSPASQATLEARAQGGDDAFWQMHDRIFESQSHLRFDDLVAHAEALGLDVPRFRQALEDGTHEEAVEADVALARQLGAAATPSFFINGRYLSGARHVEVFVDAVEEALGRAEAALEAGVAAADVYATLTGEGATEAVYRRRPAPRLALDVPDDAPRRGPADAAVVVQMFADYECGFCARAEPTLARLLEAHPDVALVFRHFPLPNHSGAEPGAHAAVEVRAQRGDETFWRFTARIFEAGERLTRDRLMAHAEAVGADPEEVGRAIDESRHASVIERDRAAILRSRRRVGTPAFVVGDVLVFGAQPYPVFEAALAEAREHGGESPAPQEK